MTHPCDACGGFAYLCGGCSGGGRYWDIRHSCARVACPVCRGAGRFPDRMPARDAVADAETLRMVCGLIPAGIFGIGTAAAMLREPYTNSWDGPELRDALEYLAPAQARLNARAAFRAVPGLRGGK